MNVIESLRAEFDVEMATTRRVLERVPDGRGEWRPHSKSFPMGHLAQLVATMPGWMTTTLRDTELDFSTFPGYTFETTATLLGVFDRQVEEARAALASSTDEDLDVLWSLKFQGRALFTRPRREVARENLNHAIHHRAQLAVYLRLVDVPVPAIYGPSADEGGDFMEGAGEGAGGE